MKNHNWFEYRPYLYDIITNINNEIVHGVETTVVVVSLGFLEELVRITSNPPATEVFYSIFK